MATIEPPDHRSIATAVGHAWAAEVMRGLHAADRDVIGAWPGTIREAKARVLARISERLETDALEELARIANLVARQGWQAFSQPDPEL
jgi:hypothetical protein